MPFAAFGTDSTSLASSAIAGLLASAPWWALPLLIAFRLRRTPSLDDVPADVASLRGRPRVSVILPARNEAAHIDACLRALRASTWPDLEIIVIDDGSTDGTAALARQASAGDARVSLLEAPPLPEGWFGKQWACHVGAQRATGSLLLFTDADTRHAPDLVVRVVGMREHRGADLISVAGRQDAGTLWEQAVQPLMFAIILARFGGATALERARHASDVVANGQCFLLSRDCYDSIGGHEGVRAFAAEDMMMAQAVWRQGGRVSMALGRAQLSTRMYDGLSSLIGGWSKNVYAAGRHAMRGGRVGQALFPAVLLSAPLFVLVPPLVLLVGLAMRATGLFLSPVGTSTLGTAGQAALIWSALATGSTVATVAGIHRFNGDPWYRALLAPLGAAVMLVIFATAIARGSSVRWKDRGYQAR